MEVIKKKNLDLVVTAHWFNRIASGEKRIEYRQVSDHWTKRLKNKEFETVTIRKGYTKTALVFKWGGTTLSHEENDLGVVPVYAITLTDF